DRVIPVPHLASARDLLLCGMSFTLVSAGILFLRLARWLSVPRNFRINFYGPAFDSVGQRFRFFDPLKAQPSRGVQTPHPVMAITNHFVQIRKRLPARS